MNVGGMCWTMNTGTASEAGRAPINVWSAGGPPVDTPIATADAIRGRAEIVATEIAALAGWCAHLVEGR